jgi:hypothetical protein
MHSSPCENMSSRCFLSPLHPISTCPFREDGWSYSSSDDSTPCYCSIRRDRLSSSGRSSAFPCSSAHAPGNANGKYSAVQGDEEFCGLQMGKPVVVASQLLNSMMDVPVPTRAEVADCADAVRQSADALMLSAETAMGSHPIKCVQTLRGV